jgi:peptide deformylase
VLRQKAKSVEQIDNEILMLIDEMIESMYEDEGVGLAAPQVGISKRIIVIDVGNDLMVLINPEIIKKSANQESLEEGCLSLPEIRVEVTRPTHISVKGLNRQSEEIVFDAEGLQARALQHEIDHLNGILIIDHASSIVRKLLRSKLKKMEKGN